MAQIFNRSTNAIARISIWGAVFIVAGVTWAGSVLNRSAYNTNQGVTIKQPVPFAHEHHVAGLGIDCRYCHTGVETSPTAGVPPTATCYNCHKLIWNDSPMLEPVRESFRTGRPLNWAKVYDLPDFVYFDHSIHVAKGIGCESCHGPVDQMPLMRRAHTLQMNWCLECHEHPERHVREKDDIFKFGSSVTGVTDSHALSLLKQNGIDPAPLLDCWICHR